MTIVVLILGLLLIVVGVTLFERSLSFRRSEKIGVKHGMVFNTKSKKLIGTETDILYDSKTGTTWLGKTRYSD